MLWRERARWATAVLAALSVAACGPADSEAPPVSAETPGEVEGSPSPDPEPAATSTPAEVPTSPDDDDWAEHLGLTEEELEERRASDDFLEWAEMRRARDVEEGRHTLLALYWHDPAGEGLWRYNNQKSLWADIAIPLRDRLLASGRPIQDASPHLDHPYGYFFPTSRSSQDEPQHYVLFGRYQGRDGSPMALVDQVLVEVQNVTEDPDSWGGGSKVADGTVILRRPAVLEMPIDRDWSDFYEQELLPELEVWLRDNISEGVGGS